MELTSARLYANPSPKSAPVPRPASSDPRANSILAAMDRDAYQRLLPALVPVDMRQGQVLWDSGRTPQHAYFPTTSVVSLLCVLSSGATAEIAVVGNEGLLGVALLLGGRSTLSRAVVRCAGRGYRLRATDLMQEFGGTGPASQVFLRYTMALMSQMAQTVACNRHHLVGQQLCRLLLLTLDRQDGETLNLTQELIAGLLGVRREGVTEAALALQKAGLIQYARGHVVVLDRAGLEQRACECYGVVKREYDRLVPGDRPLAGQRAVALQRC